MRSGVTVLILTLNEERNLPGCLSSASFADRVVVLDSGSTDATVDLALEMGVEVAHRPLDDWSSHQNWALDNLVRDEPWVLMLDADERVSPKLAESLAAAARDPGGHNAFYIRRRDWFMGRPITHVQTTPHLIRFFRPAAIRFSRFVNPTPTIRGTAGYLPGLLDHYPFSKGLSHWVARHLAYARLEAREQALNPPLKNRFSCWNALTHTDPATRRKHQKALFSRLPLRPVLFFIYLYFIRRGFLDGGPGISYAVLRSFYEYWIVRFSRLGH